MFYTGLEFSGRATEGEGRGGGGGGGGRGERGGGGERGEEKERVEGGRVAHTCTLYARKKFNLAVGWLIH